MRRPIPRLKKEDLPPPNSKVVTYYLNNSELALVHADLRHLIPHASQRGMKFEPADPKVFKTSEPEVIEPIAEPTREYFMESLVSGKKASQMARECGIAEQTVYTRLRRYGIKIKEVREENKPLKEHKPKVDGRKKDRPSREFFVQALEEGRGNLQLAEELSVTTNTISRWLKSYGLNRRSR